MPKREANFQVDEVGLKTEDAGLWTPRGRARTEWMLCADRPRPPACPQVVVTTIGGGAFGKQLGRESGTLLNRIIAFIERGGCPRLRNSEK